MKFVTIADTHSKHNGLLLPFGDVLIHAGDISMKGDVGEVASFLDWFNAQEFAYKIFIAGNHDFYFERESDDQIQKMIPEEIIYLKDSGVTIGGLKIWGSPVTPWFFNWAFNRRRGEPIRRHWDMIPEDTDILITHGPAFRRMDKNKAGQNLGCKDLFNRIDEIKPRVHVCGHIHESYGEVSEEATRFINASVVNEKYEPVNQPIVFEIG